MTVPGVNLIVAATFLAAVGDIHRFANRRQLVAYLGLDPKVRQSGDAPATHGHISKQGSAARRLAGLLSSKSKPSPPRRGCSHCLDAQAARGGSSARRSLCEPGRHGGAGTDPGRQFDPPGP